MLALLVRKQASPPVTDLAMLPASASEAGSATPREEWFGIYQGEQKIGYARRSLAPIAGGYQLRDESTLALAMLGTPQRLTTSLAAETDAQFDLRSFRFALVTPVVEGRGTIDGIETWRVSEEQQGLATHVWLADDGRAVREEAMLGFVLRAEPRETAPRGLDRAAPLDLATVARIPLRGTIANPRATTALALRVSGPAVASVPDDPPR